MPLEHSASQAAFSHNVAAERRAGKPPKQAVAIAYSEKRSAGGKDQAMRDKRMLFKGAVRDAMRRGATADEAIKAGMGALGHVIVGDAEPEWPHDKAVIQRLAAHHQEQASTYENSAAAARGKGWHGIAAQHNVLAQTHGRAAKAFQQALPLKEAGRHGAARRLSQRGYNHAHNVAQTTRYIGAQAKPVHDAHLRRSALHSMGVPTMHSDADAPTRTLRSVLQAHGYDPGDKDVNGARLHLYGGRSAHFVRTKGQSWSHEHTKQGKLASGTGPESLHRQLKKVHSGE